jgi:DNA primase
MRYVTEEAILRVQETADIVEVVQYYIPLRRSGANYKALCPFHDERVPSFMVSPSKQIYKCFGCQRGGGVFNFVMAMERVEFPEAVQILADRFGIQLNWGGQEEGIAKKELYRVNQWAADYFHHQLLHSRHARDYLQKREINKETIEAFRIGYSLPGDSLYHSARKAGFSEAVLERAGLIQQRYNAKGYRDYFRDRVMLPIFDLRNRVIGFGARALRNEEPKYLNTPETPLFRKGASFYGLSTAIQEIQRLGTAYVVEGYFDVLIPYQYGIKGLIATLGTALTPDHIKVLRRYVKRVVLIYDPDKAGEEATERGLDLLLGEDMEVLIVRPPCGLDPADCVLKEGKQSFLLHLQHPEELFAFILKRVSSRGDTSTISGKTWVIQEILRKVYQVRDPIRRQVLLQRVCTEFNIDQKILATFRPDTPSKYREERQQGQLSVEERLVWELVEIMLFENRFIPEVRKRIPLGTLSDERLKGLMQTIWRVHELTGRVEGAEVMALVKGDEALIPTLSDLLQRGPRDNRFRERLEGCIMALERRRLRRRVSELQTELAKAKRNGDQGEVERILKELQLCVKR